MDISAALATQLASLTQLLDDPDIDLETELHRLSADVHVAVPSYLAMTVTIALQGHDVSLTVRAASGPLAGDGSSRANPATSLLIPLPAGITGLPGNSLLLYAAALGAFVDLAADLSFALGVGLPDLVLDAHVDAFRTQPPSDGAMTGLDELSVINQAVGVLLGRGHTITSAHRELRRLAGIDTDIDEPADDGTYAAAVALIAQVHRPR